VLRNGPGRRRSIPGADFLSLGGLDRAIAHHRPFHPTPA